MTTIAPIVSVDDLVDHPDAVIADVRWYLDGTDARARYESGHLPGAIFVDLPHDLSDDSQPAAAGRHPLPSPDAFAAAMGRIGIGDGTTVIAYDDTGGMTAGRLVVMLRMLGHEAAVLDGGIDAWHGELMTGQGSTRVPMPFTARPWPAERLADADEVATIGATGEGVLLDARPRERFTGEVTQIDPRPGHVPGATSAPWTATIDPVTRRVRPAAELRAHYASLGADDGRTVVAYCGSGVSACMNVLAMERALMPPPRLYVGSFSGWSADPEREVELGPGR